MKLVRFLLLFLIAGCNITNKKEPIQHSVKIIFDSDMGPDFDDAGAIAILHSLAAKGECEILACCASDSYSKVAPTIETFNRYFKKPDIPVGSAVEGAPNLTAKNYWNDSVVVNFFPDYQVNKDYPSATEVYREILAAQPDQSVIIVSVGFVDNLDHLIKSKADEFSPLNGAELVKRKVKKWVAMAGRFPEGAEFNVWKSPKASYDVFKTWPTPILFSGFDIGEKIYTGGKLAEKGSDSNPVAWTYRYNLRTYGKMKLENRNSWDLTAVLCAVREPERYFYVNGPGKFIVHENGRNEWNPDIDAQHYFLVHKYPHQYIADVLDELMMFEPRSKK